MKTLLLKFLTFFFAASLLANAHAQDVLSDLNALEGIQAEESTTEEDKRLNLRRFKMQITQPVDHFAESSESFQQKIVLLHRDYEEPMVLQTSGYMIFGEYFTRLARTFNTNQIQVEHRYFDKSTPEVKDWSKLTIRQSAADFHAIVEKFKTLYPKNWVNTGSSKGGMTSIYHRRFYPNDLNGTVANVAPHSFSTSDQRYVLFLGAVGGEELYECRQALQNFQFELLNRREEVLAKMDGEFTHLGGKAVALEHAVIELPFLFWQYKEALHCNDIPEEGASIEEVMRFFKFVGNPERFLSDNSIRMFQPYFYQAAYELGAPASALQHLTGQLQHPYEFEMYLPKDVAMPEFIQSSMQDIGDWVADKAESMMFIYGEFDPWTAGAFDNIQKHSDNYLYVVPAGNHGVGFTDLKAQQKLESMKTLSRWFGKDPAISPLVIGEGFSSRYGKSLEEVELNALQGRRL